LYIPSYAIGLGGQWGSLNFPTTSGALTTTAWWMLGRAGGSDDEFTLRVRRGGTAGSDQTAYVVTTSGADSAKIVDNHKWYTGVSGGSEVMRLSNDGNVHLNSGVDVRIQLGTSGTGATSVSDNSVYVRGNDDDLILGAAGNGNIFFKENAATHMTIEPGGNVGIGTTNPSRLLHIANSAVDPYLLIDGSSTDRDSGIIINAGGGERRVVRGDLGGNLYFGNNNQIALYNGGDITINSQGNDADFRVESTGISSMLLVDAAEDVVKIGTTAGVQTAGNGNARLIVGNGIEIIQDLAANSLNKDMLRLSTAGSWSISGNSGYYSDITWDNGGTNTMGRIGLRFGSTTTGGQSEFTIRDLYQGGFGNSGNIAHFGSNKSVILEGSLKVGKTTADDTVGGINFETPTNAEAFAFTHTHSSDNSGWSVMINRQNSVGKALEFRKANSNVGSITVSASGTTYNTTSDRRLKDNIEPISDAIDKLMDMKPVTHTWIDKPNEPQVHGFIAQEMKEIIPEAVYGQPDGDEMMSMDYGRITPVVVAALQDALNEIKELKTRINKLEDK